MDGKNNNSRENAKYKVIEPTKGNKTMKKWIATYTDDYGQTTKPESVAAETYTQAYLAAYLKIYKVNGIILELTEA